VFRLGDFKAMMSGAFYLVEALDELAEFFEPGKEIAFFRDWEELAGVVPRPGQHHHCSLPNY
jgi:spore maturation protein CgeB